MKLVRTVLVAVVFLLCSLWSTLTQAQTATMPFEPPPCWLVVDGGAGKGWTTLDTPAGSCYAGWWCPTADGKWTPWRWCTIESRKTYRLFQKWVDANAASDRKTSVLAFLQSIQSPPVGAEITVYNQLRQDMLQAMQANRPPDAPPVPPSYVVTGAVAYPLNSDGTRSITVWPQAPLKGEPCDCNPPNKILQFGATFCKVPSLSALQTIVAGCGLKK